MRTLHTIFMKSPATWLVISGLVLPLSGCVASDPSETDNTNENVAEAHGLIQASDDHSVLVLDTTVTGTPSREEAFAAAAGYTVDKVSSTVWSTLTAADFGTYRAIILGDATCTTLAAVTVAIGNRSVWGPVIKGNVIIAGTDPVFHQTQGGDALTQGAVEFAADEPGTTGAYIALSCYYLDTADGTPVPLLEPFESPATGQFLVRGVGCYNDVHKVATHPALAATTDASLSNWSCSVHEAFHSFPTDFLPLAIAANITGLGDMSFADGSHGVPYIMARGKTLVPIACGDGIVNGAEQCDDGNIDNCDGCSAQCNSESCGNGTVDCGETCDDGNHTGSDGCASNCQAEICGNGTLDPGEQCDDGNTGNGDGCSSSCLVENHPPVAQCQNLALSADGTCSASAAINLDSYDPDGNLVGCTQSPTGPFGPGSYAVVLTCTDTLGLTATCTGAVTVVDEAPPQIVCPPSKTAECSNGGAVVSFSTSTSDNCSVGVASCTYPSGTTFGVGTTTNTCSVVDGSGNTSSCSFDVNVQDTVGPQITVSSTPILLWPPNHTYHNFALSDCVTNVSDACGGALSIMSTGSITRIESDEVEDAVPQGDGHTCDDILLVDATHAKLRVEREGASNGRVYTIFFKATDAAGNETLGQCSVGVPHDNSSPSSTNDGCAYCVGTACGACSTGSAGCN